MASRMQVHRPAVSELPGDFGRRIEEFPVAARLSVRSLARQLGVTWGSTDRSMHLRRRTERRNPPSLYTPRRGPPSTVA